MEILGIFRYFLFKSYRKELKKRQEETEKIWQQMARNKSYIFAVRSADEKFHFPYNGEEIPDDILKNLKIVGDNTGYVFKSLSPLIKHNLNLGLLIGADRVLGAIIWWEGEKTKYKYPIQLDSILLNTSLLPKLQSRVWHILQNWFEEIKTIK